MRLPAGLCRMLLLMPALLVTAVQAAYPERPVRMIVPQAVGASTDNVARIVAVELARELGQQVVVDNRPGGALQLGMELTAKASPDGYTIGYAPIGALAIGPHLVAKPTVDAMRELAPVGQTITGHMMLLAAPKSPFRSVREVIDYAKQNPGKLFNASSSNGSPVFPEVPTLVEAGVAGYEATTWHGVVAPAGTPRAIIAVLNTRLNLAVNSKAASERILALGSEPLTGTPEAFWILVRSDSAKWADVIKKANAKID